MVAIGICISMFWILSSNSWMQTPQGFAIENGIIVPTDWWAIVFNPFFPYRFAHMAAAAFLVSSLLVVGTAAWHLLKGRRDELVKKSFSMGLWMVLVTSCLQVVIGDNHGLNTLKHQPAKLAAIEGHWETNRDHGMPLLLFALPNMETESNDFDIVRTPKNQYNTDMSYPIHFRKKILAKLEEGQSIRAVAQHFEINKNTIVEWKKRIEIKRTRPRKPSKVDDDALRADVEQYPDDYQYERAARFGCATSTIGDALKRLNITVKKRPYGTRKQKQNSESSI